MFISYAQNYEDVMLFRALKDIEHGFYVDVGAMDPTFHSVTKAFYDRGWNGINIEPVRHWYEKLELERPNDVNLNIAVFDKPGIIKLYDIPDTGLTTSEVTIAKKHTEKSGYNLREISIPTITLNDVLMNNENNIHFLKVDVEGAEKNVLAGINLENRRPWIIVVEAIEPLSLEPNHHKWEYLLTDQRYDFVYFDGLNRFYIAEEHNDRTKFFKTPPNIFDEFIKVSEHQNNALVDTKTEENQALQSELNKKKEAHQALKNKLTKKLKENQTLKNKLIKSTEENQIIRTELTNRTNENQALQTELTNKLEEYQTLQTKLIKKVEENQTLQTEFTNKNKENQTLQTELSNKIEENHFLQNSMKTKETKLLAFSKELAEIKSSKAWKLALIFRRLRYKLAPPESWPTLLYQQIKQKRLPTFHLFRQRRHHRKFLRLIKNSALFDEDWYLSKYPDVAQAGINPIRHYLLFGGSEGRDPGPNFNCTWYLEMNSDVKTAGINPLVHYLLYGQNEGRKPQPNSGVSQKNDYRNVYNDKKFNELVKQSIRNSEYWDYYKSLFTIKNEESNE